MGLTESDKYVIDTSTAEENLKRLKQHIDGMVKGTKEVTERQKEFSDFLKADLEATLLSTAAKYDLVKQAVVGLIHFVGESNKAFIESITVSARLERALFNAGAGFGMFKQNLENSAAELERATGHQDEYIKSIQTMLIAMGVAPGEVDRFTRAALDLAAATGVDATNAAKMMARANAEGKEELKKFGITVEETADGVQGFGAVLDAVEKKFGGISTDLPQQVKDMNELKGAWETFKEAVGQTVHELIAFEKGGTAVTVVLDALSEALTNNLVKGITEAQHSVNVAQNIFGQWENQTGLVELAHRDMVVAINNAQKAGARNSEEVERTTAAYAAQLLKLQQLTNAYNAQGAGNKLQNPLNTVQSAGEYDLYAEMKKTESERAERFRERDRLAKERAREAARAREKEERELLERMWDIKQEDIKEREDEDKKFLARQKDLNGQVHYEMEVLADQEKEHTRIAKEEKEARDKLAKEEAEKLKAIVKEREDTLKGWAQTVVQTSVQMLADQLTSNTQYAREMHKIYLAKETQDLKGEAAAKRRAEIEKTLQEEAKNNILATVAETLKGIAVQAGTKAIFEIAEGVAALARYSYPEAAQHFTSAGIYASVATTAGVGAAVISSSRGLTGQESEQLEQARKDKTAREKNEKKQASERETSGQQINVYYLGITGQTDAEQGRELARIQREYSDMKTGGS